jgi:phosphatidylglycerophosphatase A
VTLRELARDYSRCETRKRRKGSPEDALSITKESSDELNPTVVITDSVVTLSRPARSLKDYLALAIATCGVGYLPLAPGTWGSVVGIGVYILVRGVLLKMFSELGVKHNFDLLYISYGVIAFELVVILAIAWAGIWAGTRTEKLSGTKDPGKVVIDEVVGQFIAMIPVPFVLGTAWWAAILAFVLFRFFDIVKPYPARRLESLESGLGIMADDIVAGVYAAIVVAIAVVISWFKFI